MRRYYRVLNLPISASHDEIREARNRLLKKYHPDCYTGNHKIAEMKSAEINEAYSAIMNYLDKQEKQVRQKAREKVYKEEKKENANQTVETKPEQEIKIKQNEPQAVSDEELNRYDFDNIRTESEVKLTEDEQFEVEKKSWKGKRGLDVAIYSLLGVAIMLIILLATGVLS